MITWRREKGELQRVALAKISAMLILAGCLDLASTLIGITSGLGLTESHPLFLRFPFAPAIGLFALILLVNNSFSAIPGKIKKGITFELIAFSFAPALWNLILILKCSGL